MNRVLIIAPHPDDEVLGCGGAIQYHRKQGDVVFVHILANRVIDHAIDKLYIKKTLQQAHKAAHLLGVEEVFFSNLRDEQLDALLIDIIVPIEEVIQRVKPDIVYIPNETDTDQDHRAVAHACMVACRQVKKILSYEIMGPRKNFYPNYFINIEVFLPNKIKALQYYESEVHPFPHPRSPEALEALAKIRGVEAQLPAAEAFKVLKEVLDK